MRMALRIGWILLLVLLAEVLFRALPVIQPEAIAGTLPPADMQTSTWQRTHRSPYAGPHTGQLKWTFQTTGAGFEITAPALGPDGTIYAGSGGALHAVNPDGSLKWRYDKCYPASMPAVGNDGTVVFSSYDGGVYAFSPSGELEWRCATSPLVQRSNSVSLESGQVGQTPVSPPVIGPDGTVYLGSATNGILAIGSDGLLKWECQVGRMQDATITPQENGQVYVRTAGGELSAISSAGELAWSLTLASRSEHFSSLPPAVGIDGLAYIVGVDGLLYAINGDGETLWKADTDLASYAGQVFCTADTLVTGDDSGQLRAFDLTGSPLWEYHTGHEELSPPVVGTEGTVFACSTDLGGDTSGLVAVNSDGSLKWEFEYKGALRNSPMLGQDGTVYCWSSSEILALSPNGRLKWKYADNLNLDSDKLPVVADDGTVFFAAGGANGQLTAISPAGERQWSYTTGGAILGTAIGSDGKSYAVASDNTLYALHPDGTLAWSHTTSSAGDLGDWWMATIFSPSVVADQRVYLKGADGTLQAFSPDGRQLWSYSSSDDLQARPGEAAEEQALGVALSSPAIGPDGKLYVSAVDICFSWLDPAFYSRLCAFDSDGSLMWSCPTGEEPVLTPVVDSTGTAYVSSYGGELYAINPDGSLKWTHSFEAPLNCAPAVGDGGMLYIGPSSDTGDETSALYALNPDGSLGWSYSLDCQLYCQPAVSANGTVYVSGGDGKLYAFGSAGALEWSFAPEEAIFGTAIISSDGTVFTAGSSGTLSAVQPDGMLKWSVAIGGGFIHSPVIGVDGTVYVGGAGGKIYAIGD